MVREEDKKSSEEISINWNPKKYIKPINKSYDL